MLASVCKLVTSLCVLELKAVSKLQIDDQVTKHVPEFERIVDFPNDASILAFLNHQSGLKKVNYDWRSSQIGSTIDWIYRLLRDGPAVTEPLAFSPSRDYLYSNFNYQVLGAVVESISGGDFKSFANRVLANDDRVFFDISECHRKAATPHVAVDGQLVPVALPFGFEHYHSSATLYSTVPLVHSLFHRYFIKGSGKELLRLCEENLRSSGVEYAPEFGACLFKQKRKLLIGGRETVNIYGHGGKELGYNTLQLILPEIETSMSIACNKLSVNIIELAFNLLRSAPLTHPSSTPR